ncbi:hypothetical protein BaRGS_00028270 [Batillaria attramentaria]|uniref:Uncharacterized protein n=1 Tax=Batillaria attramentaria TaxID=370345 RepID=A0ABD0JZW2_9CAEN
MMFALLSKGQILMQSSTVNTAVTNRPNQGAWSQHSKLYCQTLFESCTSTVMSKLRPLPGQFSSVKYTDESGPVPPASVRRLH